MKKGLLIGSLLLIVLLLGCLIFKTTYAKYRSDFNDNDSKNIAVPIMESTATTLNVPLAEIEPGDTKTFNFAITNKENNKISDVSLDYYLKIERSTNLPLIITLIKEDNNTNILDSNLETPTYTLFHSVEIIDNYTLTVYWNSADNDYQYADLVEVMDIKIIATQQNPS